MTPDDPPFQTGVVKPMQCLRAGWGFVKDEYWLFLGITLVGLLVGSVAPFAILLGPAMCGIDLCMLRRLEGKPVTFDMLFKGFDYFVQSLIAALIMVVPTFLLVGLAYALFFVAFLLLLPNQTQGEHASQVSPWLIIAVWGVFMVAFFIIMTLIGVLFFFTFPLIVDRKLTGVDAIRLSARAAWANLGGVLGLSLLNMLLGVAGTLVCCVGTYFVVPVTMMAAMVAYRQVFPALEIPKVWPVGDKHVT